MDRIVWKITKKYSVSEQTYTRVPAERLNQFEKEGYRIQQHDEDFFMIEKISSRRVVYARCIGSAEKIVKTAINISLGNTDHSGITDMNTLIDKSLALLGLLDTMFNSKNGDKTRRRTPRRNNDAL